MKKTASGIIALILAVLVVLSVSPFALAADKCADGHSFGEWETVTEPIGLIKGTRQKVCSECGCIITESFPDGHEIEDHICTICGEFDPDYTGLVTDEEYGYIYVKEGAFDDTYSGLARGDVGTFLVKDGLLSRESGLVKVTDGDLMKGLWVYAIDGQTEKVNSKGNYKGIFTGMAKNAYGWWYVKGGTIDFTYTGLGENEYGIYYMTEGKFNNKISALVKITDGDIMNGKWVYVVNGQYAKKSGEKVIPLYTGMAKNDYGWWYVKDGTIDFAFKGLAKNDYGWWYLKNGKLDLTYNGAAKNPYGWWYVVNGKVNTVKNGTVNIKRAAYRMSKGKVSRVLLDVPYVNQCPKYPTGCEAASATMMLKYYGISITLDEMIEAIPRENLYTENGRTYGPSIYEKFVGDPRKTYTSSTPGYGAFAPVVTKAINSVLENKGSNLKASNITDTSVDDLLTYVAEGKPVIVWATYRMGTPQTENVWYIKDEDGDYRFSYPRGTHVMVLCGFTSDYVYLADPYNSSSADAYSISSFRSKYKLLGYQSIVIE